MQCTHFNGTAFSTLGLTAAIDPRLPGESAQPLYLARADAPPALAALSRPGRTIPVLFHFGNSARTKDEDRIVRLLGLLDPTNPTPRELRCTLTLDDNNDGTPETAHTVAVDCVVGARNWDDAHTFRVVFHATEDVWRETTDTTDGPTSLSANGNFDVDNDGEAPAYPQIRITWTAQRASGENNYRGWKYRVLIPVANTGTRNWVNELVPINLGSVTALTTTKALASGDDVRVRLDGRELPRQLVNWDQNKYSFVVVPMTLAAGETANLELVYGNPGAGDARSERLTLDTYAGSTLHGYAAWDLGCDNGTATSGGASTITDTGKAWVVNRWAGATVYLNSGTGAGQLRRVVSNTATALTVDRAWSTNPAAATTYIVWMSGLVGWGGVWTSGGAGTTFTDSSALFSTNALIGGVVEIYSGTGSGATLYPITSNTGTVITSSATFPTMDATSRYRIIRWGFASWYVDQVEHSERWRGRNRLNRHQDRPSRVWWRSDGIPGAWDRVKTLPNGDDARQVKWTAFSDGGGNDYIGMLDVRRKRGSDDTFDEEGIADGEVYYSAFGIRGARFDYDYLNEAGVGKIVFLSKQPGGEAWEVAHEVTTTQATLTAQALTYVDLTPTEGDLPLHVAQSVWPADEVEIPDTADVNNEADVQDDETIELYLGTSDITIDGLAPSAYVTDFGDEVAVYDMQQTLVYGASLAAATHVIRVGRNQAFDDVGEGGAYLHLPAADVLVIDCATGEVFTYTGSITATSYTKQHASHAAVVYEQVNDPDSDGSLIRVPSSDWMPLPGNATTTVRVEETGMGTLSVYFVWAEGYTV